jgi:hypothetical protein
MSFCNTSLNAQCNDFKTRRLPGKFTESWEQGSPHYCRDSALSWIFNLQVEIVEKILSDLTPQQLHIIILSCKAGRAHGESISIWRQLCTRDYPQLAQPMCSPPSFSPAVQPPKLSYRLAAANAAVFVAGGCSLALAAVSEVHRFLLGSRRMAEAPPLSTPRMFAAVARLGDLLFVSGGCNSLSSCLRRFVPSVLPLGFRVSP